MSTATMKLYDGKRPLSVYESLFLLAGEHDYRLPRSILRAASKAAGFGAERITDALAKLGATVAGEGDALAYLIPRDQRHVAAVKLSDDPGTVASTASSDAFHDRMSTAEARDLLGVEFDRLVRSGKLRLHRGKGKHKWEVMRADVLAVKDRQTRGRNADDVIAQKIAQTRSGLRHPSDPTAGSLKFSDDHEPAQERDNAGDMSAYRERRRYRRNGC